MTGKTLGTLRKQKTRQCYKNVLQISENLLDGRKNCRNVRKNFWKPGNTIGARSNSVKDLALLEKRSELHVRLRNK